MRCTSEAFSSGKVSACHCKHYDGFSFQGCVRATTRAWRLLWAVGSDGVDRIFGVNLSLIFHLTFKCLNLTALAFQAEDIFCAQYYMLLILDLFYLCSKITRCTQRLPPPLEG